MMNRSLWLIPLALCMGVLTACSDDPLALPKEPNHVEEPVDPKEPDQPEEPKAPVARTFLGDVAVYSSKKDGSFMTNHDSEAVELMTWDEAKAMSVPQGYYLPSQYDWERVIPRNVYIGFGRKAAKQHSLFSYDGQLYYAEEYIESERGEDVAYALRFMKTDAKRSEATTLDHNKFLTAFRYAKVADKDEHFHFVIEAVLLGESFEGDISAIANDAFWAEHKEQIESLFLETGGMQEKYEDEAEYEERSGLGTSGYFWSADEQVIPGLESGNAYYAGVNNGMFGPAFPIEKITRLGVRLFKERPKK